MEKFADWQVVQTTIVSSLHAGILQKGSKKKAADLQVPTLPGLWRERTKTPVPLLKHAAAFAFWDISNFYIKLLLQDKLAATFFVCLGILILALFRS